MYIQIGGDMAVRDRSLIGIFDLDNASYSKHTRNFLKDAEENGSVITVSDELPKAFVLTQEFGMDRVYLTQFSASTLEKRFSGGMEKAGV
jgi:hypothetical protein